MVRAYCNVKVYRLKRKDGVEISRELVAKSHNMVLDAGLDQLRDALNGAAWQLSAVGLGSSSTAVNKAQTWGLSPLMVAAPTSSYNQGSLFRTTLLLEEDDLNGSTIQEVWVAPTTTAPPTGAAAYSRAVISPISKTSQYAYLFIIDCSWGDGCQKAAWSLLAALAKSGGAFTVKADQVLLGQGSTPVTVDDVTLDDPWVMTPLIAYATVTGTGELTLYAAMLPDQFNGLTLREVGLYFTLESGAAPAGITVPGLYHRGVLASPFTVQVGQGAQVAIVIKWEDA